MVRLILEKNLFGLDIDGRAAQLTELLRMMMKAQGNALHQAMPFLFERIGDETARSC